MSNNGPGARRLPAGAAVAPFHWGAQAPQPAAEQAPARPAAAASLPRPAAVTPPAASPAGLADIEREAFAKGYQQGERAGYEAGAKRAEATLRRLGETIDELGDLRRTAVHQIEMQVVRLALEIARRILHREVSMDRHLAEAMVRVALDRLGATGPITIRLHPDDVAAVSDRVRTGDGSLTLVADANVSRGGCLVEADAGFVDGGLDAQFAEIAHALFEDEERHPARVAARG